MDVSDRGDGMERRAGLEEKRIQGTPMRPLKMYRMCDENRRIDVPYHWQANVEILLIRRGRLHLWIQEKEYTGVAGDLFYINPGELHGMQAEDTDCLYFAFVFPKEYLRFAQADEAEEVFLRPLLEGKARVKNYLPAAACGCELRELMEEIVELYDCHGAGVPLGIKADIFKFYYHLYRGELVRVITQGNTERMKLLADISQYIREHCGEKLSLTQMGAEFNMSPKYFSVFFQHHFMKAFTDYLNCIRIEKARQLLLETELDLEHIASQTGFSSSSYLIRVFKELTGMTPRRYRGSFLAAGNLFDSAFKVE